jgi:hypothetical protein
MSWPVPASTAHRDRRGQRLGRRVLLTLGGLWTLPNTLLGLALGALGWVFGARMDWRGRDRALVFARMPCFGGALTLGNVVLHGGDSLEVACHTYAHRAGCGAEPPVRLADHERAHVYQYMVLGPLFLPLYLCCGGVGVRNRFERAADRYARDGRGWWPWPCAQPRYGAHAAAVEEAGHGRVAGS